MEIPLSPDASKSLYIALSDQLEDGLVLRALCDGAEIIRFERLSGAITVSVSLPTDSGAIARYSLYAPEAKGSLSLYRTPARVALYADDALADEEWPLYPFPEGAWTLEPGAGVPVAQFSGAAEPKGEAYSQTRPMHLFSPEGHNASFGDAMPYWDGERFRLFYLLDRRSHGSKNGLGAHRWAQAHTADLRKWTFPPIAVDIDDIREGSICTGSLALWEGRYYAFFAVRSTDGSPARLSWATSEDGERFTKSDRFVTLSAPFDPVSARDPMVFLGPDGEWNMLVTTSIAGEYEGGCLAWLRGKSPVEWRLQETPFLAPGYPGQPECADWFRWGNRYYLAFSVCGVARYRVSDTPYGPWRTPEDDLLGSPGLNVSKTAAFGERRIAVGFLSGGGYAGRAVFEEIAREADGSLSAKVLEEVLPDAESVSCPETLEASAPEGLNRALLAEISGGFRLRAKVFAQKGECGFSFCVPGALSPCASLRLNPSEERISLIAGDAPLFSYGRCQRRAPGLFSGADVDIVFAGGAIHAVVNGKSLTLDLGSGVEPPLAACFYALWGSARAESIRLERFSEDANGQ